ncbi:hypothetical protein DFP73DRAFT_580627 [Morchella snyderi]|nr:hypothetical protein DFP73DRAFT_580627 [Morchella snyderi]
MLRPTTPPKFPTTTSKSDEPVIPDPAVFTVTPLATTAHAPPSVSQCAVHLELLQAISKLKHRVVKEAAFIEIFGTVDEERETWWGAFVEVAVGRFGTWWWGVEEELRRREGTISCGGGCGGGGCPGRALRELPEDLLPPLDVLMVWHAYMLNPRFYNEDAIHHGLHLIHSTAFPWAHIHAAINNDTFTYTLPDAAARFFERLTNQSPRLMDELLWKDVAPRKSIKCPACGKVGAPVRICDSEKKGGGWMDAGFKTDCDGCGAVIDKEALCSEKLRTEIGEFIKAGPGARMRMTNLNSQGRTHGEDPTSPAWEAMDFVNDLFRRTFSASPQLGHTDTFHTISARLHAAISPASTAPPAAHTAALALVLNAFSATPRNFSTNLTAAVVRQSSFIAKMNDKLWIRSPGLAGRLPPDALASGATRARLAATRSCVIIDGKTSGDGFLARAVARYERFFALFARHPGRMLVPTLDVDLVWHSAMLAPVGYRAWCRAAAARFVDHDDRVGTGALDEAFAFTERAYARAFAGEVYARCCCWFCEAAVSEGVEVVEGADGEGGGRGGVWARVWARRRGGGRRERAVRVRVEFYKEVERRRRAGEAGLAWGGLGEALKRC